LISFSAPRHHIQPVSEDGDKLVTFRVHCNSERGSKAVMDMYTQDD
jgi:hypothetical protein